MRIYELSQEPVKIPHKKEYSADSASRTICISNDCMYANPYHNRRRHWHFYVDWHTSACYECTGNPEPVEEYHLGQRYIVDLSFLHL